MEREAIGIGATIEEAQQAACRQLGMETHEVEFEVLQMPEKKKFGLFGGAPAKVRAYISITPASAAADYLREILEKMGAQGVQINIEEVEDGAVLNLSGDNIGFIIGHRGETLDALQYLTGLVANHVDNSYYRITINTGNYREKREKTLESLARKMAIKAVKTGRNSSLEPMNPYERRIIHTTVQKVNGAISWSEGEDMGRHVVIGPDPKVKQSFRPRREGGRPRNNNFRSRSQSQDGTKGEAAAGAGTQPRPEIKKNAAAYEKIVPGIPAQPKPVQEKKPVKDESPVSPLYGKIEPKKGE